MLGNLVRAKIKHFRKCVYLVISPHRGDSGRGVQKLSHYFDWFIAVMILISSSLAFVSTFGLPGALQNSLAYLENGILWIFTVEYLLRVWTADLYFNSDKKKRKFERFRRTWKFIWSPLAVVDLLVILPFWISVPVLANPKFFMALRFVRIVRLLRYAKRYEKVLDNMVEVLKEQKKELKVSLIAIGALMMVASLLMYAAEHDEQPEKFCNAFSGLWWAVTTITTLGYGDITPITAFGRFCGAIITLAGVAALAVPTAIINSGFVKRSITVEDIKDIMSKKDQEQDRQLEKQRQMINDLANRFVEFREHLLENEKIQNEKLEQHKEGLRRLSEDFTRFSADTKGRFVRFEKILLEKDRMWREVIEEQKQRVDRFAETTTDHFMEFKKLMEENGQKQKEAQGWQQKMDRLWTAVKDHLDGVEQSMLNAKDREERVEQLAESVGGRLTRMETSMEDQQRIIAHYFTPKEKADGALLKTLKRVRIPWWNKVDK